MAMPPTRRHRRTKQSTAVDKGALLVQMIKHRLMNQDSRADAAFLEDMRSKQAAGRLVSPATPALLDRLERTM